MNKNRAKKIYSTIIGILEYLLSIAAIYFIFRLIINNWNQFQEKQVGINIEAAVASFVTFLLALFIQGVGWFYLHKRIGKEVRFLRLLDAYFTSNLMRYVPGNVWSYLARVNKQKKLNISESETLYLSLIEIILFIVSGWIIFIISIFFWTEPFLVANKLIIFFIVTVLFVVFAIFGPQTIKWYIKRYMKGRHISFAFIRLPWHYLIKIFFIYFIYWFVSGLAFYFSIISITNFPFVLIIIAIGINAVAWIIGFISFITPSGLGVREPAIIFFLTSYLPAGISGAISIFSRILMVVAEIFMVLMIKLYILLFYGREAPKK